MTKTLTEQYKFGEIATNYYWCKIWGEDALVIKWLVGDNEIHQSNLIEEVLAPVPSYDQFVELTKKVEQLKEDNKYLKSGIETRDKQIEQLVKQLKEANEVIKFYANTDGLNEEEKQMNAEKYHLVYGLKAYDYIERYGVE